MLRDSGLAPAGRGPSRRGHTGRGVRLRGDAPARCGPPRPAIVPRRVDQAPEAPLMSKLGPQLALSSFAGSP